MKQFIINGRNIFDRNPFIEHQQSSTVSDTPVRFQMIGNFKHIESKTFTVKKKKKKRYPPKHLEMDGNDEQIVSKTDVENEEIASDSDSETVDINVEIFGDDKVLDEMGIKREDLNEAIDDLVTKLISKLGLYCFSLLFFVFILQYRRKRGRCLYSRII